MLVRAYMEKKDEDKKPSQRQVAQEEKEERRVGIVQRADQDLAEERAVLGCCP